MLSLDNRWSKMNNISTEEASQGRNVTLLHLFNLPLTGRVLLLHHFPSRSWFIGLVLLETKNTLKMLGWNLPIKRIESADQKNALMKCLKALNEWSIKHFVSWLPCSMSPNQPRKNLSSLPSECHQFIPTERPPRCKTFPKGVVNVFLKVSPEIAKTSKKITTFNEQDEVYIKIEGNRLIGRPWDRLIKEPRKRW